MVIHSFCLEDTMQDYICQNVGLFGIKKHVKGVMYTNLRIAWMLWDTKYLLHDNNNDPDNDSAKIIHTSMIRPIIEYWDTV